uniref:Chromosome 3 open reading frame 33 n=2 Tax=Latimeria chalumnae TaxID=7897 RepID=H3ACV9_LATCH
MERRLYKDDPPALATQEPMAVGAMRPEKGARQEPEEEEGEQRGPNFIAIVSGFLDKHMNIVRAVSTGLALAGVIVLARSIRLTTRFSSAVDIPVEFIEKRVKLRGKIHRLTEEGLLVEHIPIHLPLISSLQARWNSKGLLLIRLAGVELTHDGKVWLKEQLTPSQTLWFKLLRRENSALDCLVLINRGGFFSVCLNEEILSQGFGRIAPIEGLQLDSRIYWKLHRRLLQAELRAQRKGRGLWKEPSRWERISENIKDNKIIQSLKNFFKWIVFHVKK